MQMIRSSGQADLSYMLLTDRELPLLAELLRKPRKTVSSEAKKLAEHIRAGIKEVQ